MACFHDADTSFSREPKACAVSAIEASRSSPLLPSHLLANALSNGPFVVCSPRFLILFVGELEASGLSKLLFQFAVMLRNSPQVVAVLCGNLVPDSPNLVDFVVTHSYRGFK